MKKYLSLSIIILFISSCEVNDFCTKKVVTPKISILFKNKKNTSQGKPALLIWAPGRKEAINIENDNKYIELPLDPTSNTTRYLIAIIGKEKNTSEIEIKYNFKDKFISRSCGYKRVYTNINIQLIKTKNNWIKSISETKIPNINDQKKPHTIFYY